MNKSSLRIIAIGYAKRALEQGTREHERMKNYASFFDEYHVIVFTRKSEGFPDKQQVGNLYLHATNAHTRVGMLWRAYLIGREIVNSRTKQYLVTSQDPFEAALVGRAVAKGNRATDHVQIHGDVFNPRSYQHSLLQRLRVIYGRYVVRHSSCIRVVSERIKHSLILLGVPASTITVLPIYAELEQFLKIGAKRTHVIADSLDFLYVGRFSPEKNLPLLIRSFATVAQNYGHTRLTLLGSGPQRAELVALVAKLGIAARVTFLPWTDNVSAAMATHDVFCLSSDHEGWGMVLLEAAAAGMPIVTTDVGCADVCVRDGENGQVVLVGDQAGYVTAMERYCVDPSLVATQGVESHQIAQCLALPEVVYQQKIVDAFTSCVL